MASESSRERRKSAWRAQICVKSEIRERFNTVRQILKSDPLNRTKEEVQILIDSEEIVKEIQQRAQKQAQAKSRMLEVLDPPEVLEDKSRVLAEAIRQAKCVVVYTGAGISTAASIPDYRGPDGIWTRLSRGEKLGSYNLTDAEPTLAHMSITKLHQEGLVQHVVSQNCDGLHIRSGLPGTALSEVHGNMFVEVCTECDPDRLFFRLFDVTERTRLRRHQTGRQCFECGAHLRDTIVHFGEKGCLEEPLNWQGAFDKAKVADCILCLGSSLKVLKRYHDLWGMRRVKNRRPKLFIVNLQWTPKDDVATLKLNGRCDDVMRRVMAKLGFGIPEYKRSKDPLFTLATPLRVHEMDSFSTKYLVQPGNLPVKGHLLEHLQSLGPELSDSKLRNDREDENNEKEVIVPKRPGWFGKGYAKNKRSTKKRKTR